MVSGYSIVISASEPIYKTGLQFLGPPSEGEEHAYVITEKPLPDVPNTVEAWIKVSPDFYGTATIFGTFGTHQHSAAGYPSEDREGCNFINFEIRPAGFRVPWNDDEVVADASPVEYPRDEWIHYAVVRDETVRRGIFTFYKNGEEVFTWLFRAGTSVIPRDRPFIGGDYRSLPDAQLSNRSFDGKIGELRVWSTSRTATEIKENMNKELAGDEEGLIGYWKFNEGEGEIVHDYSPYENHGTIVNVKWYPEPDTEG